MKCYRVHDWLYRGSRPETATDFCQLVDIGIKTILNVEGGILEDISSDPNYQQTMSLMSEIQQVRLAMNAIRPPPYWEVNTCLSIITRAGAQPQKYGPVYVHCRKGVDRTGFLVAAYRMKVDEWSYERAVAEMVSMGFHRWYFYWLPSLRKWRKGV
jgi:protein tyrosine/serine phosphatase